MWKIATQKKKSRWAGKTILTKEKQMHTKASNRSNMHMENIFTT